MNKNFHSKQVKWTEEKCYEVAKQCHTKTEMKKRFCCAFERAKKYGWLEQYTWFRTTEIKWTREACYELAKQCRSKTHFRETSKGAYDAANRYGWLHDYTWFNPNYNPNKVKWTEEACYNAAKECSNVTEFRETYYGAYNRSKKYGWIERYTWFQNGKRDVYKKIYTVYAYEDVVNKKVYIGLTNNIKRRIMEHKKKDYKHSFRKYDRVREYFENCGMDVPEPVVLINNIDGIEAQEKEGFYVKYYQDNGWSTINTSKTGKGSSSLGNVGTKMRTNTIKNKYIKPHKEITTAHKQSLTEIDCFNAASKCQYKREFRENYPKEYAFASSKKWLKTYTWLKGCKRIITNEECINAAKQCSTKCDFRERFFYEYMFARENGLLQCFTWLKRKKRES